MRLLRLIARILPMILLPAFAQNAEPTSNSAVLTSGSPQQHAAPSGLNVCGFEVLNKINGKDLGTYSDKILMNVRTTWDKLIARADLGPLPVATTLIEVVINEDGSEASVRTAESSGNQSLDAMALQAVSSAGPFGPFPAELHEKELKLRYHFGYSQPSKAPICGEFHPTGKVVAMKPGGPVSPPTAKLTPDPEYSEQARRAKYQGLVVLGGVVDESGSFRNICMLRGAGWGLDEKAIEAVKTWKFEPANRQGVPVAVFISIQVTFRLY